MEKEKLKKLISERDQLDSQLAALRDVLKSHDVTMETPLVDAEGFPDPNLDIISIRKARHSITCLTNDRKFLTDEIEKLLLAVHETSRTNAMDVDSSASTDGGVHRTTNKPFLKVENVLYGSPAFDGGLAEEDLIVQCGPVHGDNFEGLERLSAIIADHVGRELRVTVLRGAKVHRLSVKPNKWTGAGIFGARLNVVRDVKF